MINILIVILFIAAIVALQLYLSKQKNKWLGLILPLMTMSISLMALLGVVTFYSVQSIESQIVTEDGVVTKQVTAQPIKVDTSTIKESIFLGGYILVLYNIPTVILLLIYKGAREKLKRELEIKKMNIQDLE